MKRQLLPALLLQITVTLQLSAQFRYFEPVFDEVTVTQNIQYGVNATVIAMSTAGQAIPQMLLLDLYEPAGDTLAARPLVIVLPGGSFLPPQLNGACSGAKNDSSVVEICRRLAKMGYVAAAADYRLGWNPVSSDGNVRLWTYIHALYRGIQDARTAVRFFKKTAVEDGNNFRVDTSRIVLWGDAAGGNIALGAAYAREYNDWVKPALMIPIIPNVMTPVILEDMDGNIWGTSTGVVPPGFPAALGVPGDTMCYPNWPGYSSDFQLCVSAAGFLPDTAWISTGEIPAILYHAPNDATQPCPTGILGVPPIFLNVIEVSGSCAIAGKLDANGNNQVFIDAGIDDCVTANATALNGDLEGFYPFIGLDPLHARPWNWTAPCPNNPSAPVDGALARQYIDTVMAYFATRASAALALGSIPANLPGICGPALKGTVFLDVNDNGYDAADLPLPGVVLELQPGNRHAVSGPNGKYTIHPPAGSYTLSVPNPPAYFAPTNTPASVVVPATGDTVQFVGLKATATVHDLRISLTPLTDPRPGFFNRYTVTWKNAGTTQISGSVSLSVDPNYILMSATPAANISGSTATWTFTNLPPFQSGSASLLVQLPPSVPLGTLLNTSAVVEPANVSDNNPADNTIGLEQPVIGSYDPNDKRVWPEGNVTETVLAAAGNTLDYTVRFQNTGTASAVNVFIVDTLSNLLNINTLEVLGTSHPMRMEISGQRTITWFFDQINLPDSTADEPASHGFVRYRVQPLLPFGNLLNKTAENFADIYFDFNDPVRTNTAETHFVETSGTNTPLPVGEVNIAPNPARGAVTLTGSLPESAGEAVLNIYDISGKMVVNRNVATSGRQVSAVVQTDGWLRGTYFVKIVAGRNVLAGRFVRE